MKPFKIKTYTEVNEFYRDTKLKLFSDDYTTEKEVAGIINQVRNNGDKALRNYTLLFDKVERDSISVTQNELNKVKTISRDILSILKKSAENIKKFHMNELKTIKKWMMKTDTGRAGQIWTPIKRIGVYIPGGTAVYPSTVLMNVIPAKVAGVEEIALTSPPCKDTGLINPLILASAQLLGIKEIYAVGGAQAIAAFAYGTESIKPVDKITGPGNTWVAEAKRQVFGKTGIDSIAGPTELAVIADKSACPEFIAADLLSQAEHDTMARVFLISIDRELLSRVEKEIFRQLSTLPRKNIASESLLKNSFFVKVDSVEQAVEVVNRIAPEHLELQIKDCNKFINMLSTSGAIFCGNYSAESIGDYWAGPNHTLPTGSTARFSSALSVRDFIRWTSIIYCKKKKLRKIFPFISKFARAENLEAHARAVEIRFNKEITR